MGCEVIRTVVAHGANRYEAATRGLNVQQLPSYTLSHKGRPGMQRGWTYRGGAVLAGMRGAGRVEMPLVTREPRMVRSTPPRRVPVSHAPSAPCGGRR